MQLGKYQEEQGLKITNIHKEERLVDENGNKYVYVDFDVIVKRVHYIEVLPEKEWEEVQHLLRNLKYSED